MRFAVVYVEEERPRGREHPVRLPQSGFEKGEVVRMAVVVAAAAQHRGAVAGALEAVAVTILVALDPDAGEALSPPGVEGRVHVDELDAAPVHRLQHREVVGQDDPAGRTIPAALHHESP